MQDAADQSTHVFVKLEQDDSGFPPFEAEELDATAIGGHEFRLTVTPTFASGLAFADIVRCVEHEAEPWITELVRASGHSSVRVVPFGVNSISELRENLQTLGCTARDTIIDGMIAVDVPPTVDFESVLGLLLPGRTDGRWDYDVGVRGT